MKRSPRGKFICVVGMMLAAMGASYAQSQAAKSSALSAKTAAKPLLLEKNEGELRIRRARPDNSVIASPQLMLKVSPKNNGSQHLVLGTEDIPPGGSIPKHKHLEQDEILLIETGVAHVWLGDQERDAHAGALVFIPANTWIALKNTGSEAVSLVFIFSAPGFEDYMRCTSVPANEKPGPISAQERRTCAHHAHAMFKDLQEAEKK